MRCHVQLRLRAIPSPEQLFNASGFRLAFDPLLVFYNSSCGVCGCRARREAELAYRASATSCRDLLDALARLWKWQTADRRACNLSKNDCVFTPAGEEVNEIFATVYTFVFNRIQPIHRRMPDYCANTESIYRGVTFYSEFTRLSFVCSMTGSAGSW